MISGGEGGLSMGPIEMKTFEIINATNPVKDKELAEEFVSLLGVMTKSIFAKESVEFQITGDPVRGYYIWYKVTEKHAL